MVCESGYQRIHVGLFPDAEYIGVGLDINSRQAVNVAQKAESLVTDADHAGIHCRRVKRRKIRQLAERRG